MVRAMRILAAVLLSSLPAFILAQDQRSRATDNQDIRFRESVDVDRVLVDARVIDGHGRPIVGLAVADFQVRVDGKPVVLESVQWVPAPGAARTHAGNDNRPDGNVSTASNTDPAAEADAPSSPGRLIVFFFQKDLEPSRIIGLMHMQEEAIRLLGTLGPEDRVAVASYDSHLKLWLDFTDERARLRQAIKHSILFEGEPGPLQGS